MHSFPIAYKFTIPRSLLHCPSERHSARTFGTHLLQSREENAHFVRSQFRSLATLDNQAEPLVRLQPFEIGSDCGAAVRHALISASRHRDSFSLCASIASPFSRVDFGADVEVNASLLRHFCQFNNELFTCQRCAPRLLSTPSISELNEAQQLSGGSASKQVALHEMLRRERPNRKS